MVVWWNLRGDMMGALKTTFCAMFRCGTAAQIAAMNQTWAKSGAGGSTNGWRDNQSKENTMDLQIECVGCTHHMCVSYTWSYLHISIYIYIYMHMRAQYDYVYVLHLSIYLSIHPSTHLSIYVHIHENKMWECDCPIISRCLYIIPQFNIMGCPWMP
jgi:hypothetical protein